MDTIISHLAIRFYRIIFLYNSEMEINKSEKYRKTLNTEAVTFSSGHWNWAVHGKFALVMGVFLVAVVLAKPDEVLDIDDYL